jgi:hypothetical protein
MIFSQSELRTLGTIPVTRTFSMVNESLTKIAENMRYVFLSHSNLDSELAKGLVNKVRRLGINVYFDLYDSSLTLPPSGDTAKKLRTRIKNATHFILLATKNSVTVSRWCPWELGCADGFAIPISIAQTKDEKGQEWGAEYLKLYHSIEILNDKNHVSHMARIHPRNSGNSVQNFKNWCDSSLL